MLDRLKNVIKSNTKNGNNTVKPNSDNKPVNKNSGKSGNSFGGLTQSQIKNSIKNAGKNDALSSARLGDDAQIALDSYKEKESAVRMAASSSLEEIIATTYSEGDIALAIEKLRIHLNENKGKVDKNFWYMLMDCYQVIGNQPNFDRTAIAFAHSFEASPPSWNMSNNIEKNSVLAGKNIMILEPIFKFEHTEKFKEFYKAARQEKFCRINVSQCRFEESEVSALKALYQLFLQLRKGKVMSILMGDNNIIEFCKSYINPNPIQKNLKQTFIDNESLFWLIYLEILQWKNKHDEFEELAFEYAKKFEISPPGWEVNGVMLYDKSLEEEEIVSEFILTDKVLTSNNIESLLNIIQNDFNKSYRSEIDLSSIERIDFAAAGAISHFIQELWTSKEHENKEVIFKHPNKMITVLLDMVGVTEFVKIIPKNT